MVIILGWISLGLSIETFVQAEIYLIATLIKILDILVNLNIKHYCIYLLRLQFISINSCNFL